MLHADDISWAPQSDIVVLPSPPCRADTIKWLVICGADNLIHLDGLCDLTHLTHIYITRSGSLTALPDGIGVLIDLNSLQLRSCISLLGLPVSVGMLSALTTLDLPDCTSLTSIPPSIGMISMLEVLNLNRCSSLTQLPPTIGKLASLETLTLSNCDSLSELPSEIGRLCSLRRLCSAFCGSLTSLPASLSLLRYNPDFAFEHERHGFSPERYNRLGYIRMLCCQQEAKGPFLAMMCAGRRKQLPRLPAEIWALLYIEFAEDPSNIMIYPY